MTIKEGKEEKEEKEAPMNDAPISNKDSFSIAAQMLKKIFEIYDRRI